MVYTPQQSKSGSLIALHIMITSSLFFMTLGMVDVTYLIGIPRLNSSSYQDYYFHCSTTGKNLQWLVNGSILANFSNEHIPNVTSNEKQNFNYIATLLSVHQIQEENLEFNSILIISSHQMLKLYITCTNELYCNSISNQDNGRSIVKRNSINSSILLEYLLTQDLTIGLSHKSHISIFVCQTTHEHEHEQTWSASNVDTNYRFTDYFPLGHNFHTKQDNSLIKNQAILIGNSSHVLVSVLLVLDTPNVTVTCKHKQNQVQLTSRAMDLTTTTPKEEPTNTTVKEASTSEKVLNNGVLQSRSVPTQTFNGALAGSVIISFLFGGILTGTIMYFIFWIKEKKNGESDFSSGVTKSRSSISERNPGLDIEFHQQQSLLDEENGEGGMET